MLGAVSRGMAGDGLSGQSRRGKECCGEFCCVLSGIGMAVMVCPDGVMKGKVRFGMSFMRAEGTIIPLPFDT